MRSYREIIMRDYKEKDQRERETKEIRERERETKEIRERESKRSVHIIDIIGMMIKLRRSHTPYISYTHTSLSSSLVSLLTLGLVAVGCRRGCVRWALRTRGMGGRLCR